MCPFDLASAFQRVKAGEAERCSCWSVSEPWRQISGAARLCGSSISFRERSRNYFPGRLKMPWQERGWERGRVCFSQQSLLPLQSLRGRGARGSGGCALPVPGLPAGPGGSCGSRGRAGTGGSCGGAAGRRQRRQRRCGCSGRCLRAAAFSECFSRRARPVKAYFCFGLVRFPTPPPACGLKVAFCRSAGRVRSGLLWLPAR